jgi:hypothetical protein
MIGIIDQARIILPFVNFGFEWKDYAKKRHQEDRCYKKHRLQRLVNTTDSATKIKDNSSHMFGPPCLPNVCNCCGAQHNHTAVVCGYFCIPEYRRKAPDVKKKGVCKTILSKLCPS